MKRSFHDKRRTLRPCRRCGAEFLGPSSRHLCPDCLDTSRYNQAKYVPTPDQIAAECAAIRAVNEAAMLGSDYRCPSPARLRTYTLAKHGTRMVGLMEVTR